jgi:hypothetical protein
MILYETINKGRFLFYEEMCVALNYSKTVNLLKLIQVILTVY